MSLCGAVNQAIFKELARLDEVDAGDKDAMAAEIERAKAVKGLTESAISNGNLALHVAQASTDVGQAVRVPKELLGS